MKEKEKDVMYEGMSEHYLQTIPPWLAQAIRERNIYLEAAVAYSWEYKLDSIDIALLKETKLN